jgi:hypothetical protein
MTLTKVLVLVQIIGYWEKRRNPIKTIATPKTSGML